LTALLPRYINIRRGGYVAAIVGLSMNPWLLFKSSATFSNYLGAYGVLLSCVAGPMICDYYLVRRGHYRIRDLYTTDRGGWYWYSYGVNWRAYLAYFSGFAINAPGFIHSLNPDINVHVAAQRLYALVSLDRWNTSRTRANPQSWLTGTGVSALVYYLACVAAPPPGMNRSFHEVDESEGEVMFAGAVEDVDGSEKSEHIKGGARSPQVHEVTEII